jgi:hypothetical protein
MVILCSNHDNNNITVCTYWYSPDYFDSMILDHNLSCKDKTNKGD